MSLVPALPSVLLGSKWPCNATVLTLGFDVNQSENGALFVSTKS